MRDTLQACYDRQGDTSMCDAATNGVQMVRAQIVSAAGHVLPQPMLTKQSIIMVLTHACMQHQVLCVKDECYDVCVNGVRRWAKFNV